MLISVTVGVMLDMMTYLGFVEISKEDLVPIITDNEQKFSISVLFYKSGYCSLATTTCTRSAAITMLRDNNVSLG